MRIRREFVNGASGIYEVGLKIFCVMVLMCHVACLIVVGHTERVSLQSGVWVMMGVGL